MASRRLARVNEQLKREISHILRRDVRDPRVGLVVVTGVEASADLSVARVYVRPAGGEKDWESLRDGLSAAASFVRRELAQDLSLRKVPELVFEMDRTLERARRIEKILDEVRPSGDPDDGPDGSSSGDPDLGSSSGSESGSDGGTGT